MDAVLVIMLSFRALRQTCVPFTRAPALCGTGVPGRPRTAINENSAFIDASGVYGSDASTANALRAGAFLRSVASPLGEPIPPHQGDEFQTGDDRASLFVGLLSFHAVFLRHHNRFVFGGRMEGRD